MRLENGGPKSAVSCRTAETCQTTRLRRVMKKPNPTRPMPKRVSVPGSGTGTVPFRTPAINGSPSEKLRPPKGSDMNCIASTKVPGAGRGHGRVPLMASFCRPSRTMTTAALPQTADIILPMSAFWSIATA